MYTAKIFAQKQDESFEEIWSMEGFDIRSHAISELMDQHLTMCREADEIPTAEMLVKFITDLLYFGEHTVFNLKYTVEGEDDEILAMLTHLQE